MATCALSLTHAPIDPLTGWVFGSDEERCDFLLATSNTESGVSGRHFSINYNWTTKCLLLKNLSRHSVTMKSPKLYGHPVTVEGTQVIPPSEDNTIHAGVVVLIVRIPARGQDEDYGQTVKEAMPCFPPRVLCKDPPNTPPVILGKRNRVQYIIQNEGDIGKGGFGSVSKALDPNTGDLYAAKRFHKSKAVNKFIYRELELHRKVSHVSLLCICY